MSLVIILFFTVLLFGLAGVLLLIFIQSEPANLVIFIIFSVFTLLVNGMFITILPENDQNMRVAAYICGCVAILAIMLRILFPKMETLSKLLVVLSLIAAIIGTFFI